MIKGFRDFILRGNAIDLAVGVIIGAAFTGVVNALAQGLLTPMIGLIFGQPDFSRWDVAGFGFGTIVNALVSFLTTAFVLYFFVVSPMNVLTTRLKAREVKAKAEAETQAQAEAQANPPEPSQSEILLAEIRDLLKQQAK